MDRRVIPVVLRHYGVPDPAVADVMQLYHGSSAAVSTRFGLTEAFDTTSGVLQGDTQSPHILIQIVDYVLRQSLVDEDRFTMKPANGRRDSAVTLTALAYANDVSIISAEVTSCRLQFHSEAIGLKLNAQEQKFFMSDMRVIPNQF